MSPRALPLVVVALALCLGGWARIDALSSGFWADDYIQHAMLERVYPSQRPVWDLFHFVDGSASDRRRIVEYGVDPWWTHPQFRLSLLRPLPSILRALDHSLFRENALAQHAHSLLWWVLLVLVVATLLFSLLPPLSAAFAVLFFSLDESQTVPVLWLSNRSALIATVFSIAALLCHLRFRRGGRPAWRGASFAVLALALACGEYALASCGYILCCELGSRFDGLTRVRALAPLLALMVGFVVLSAALGYGAAHSALYTSPFSAPLTYAAKLPTGLPVFMGELALGVPADWWSFGSPWPAQLQAWLGFANDQWSALPSWHFWQVCLGILGAALAFSLLAWLHPRIDAGHRQALLWLVAGAIVGVLPVLSSFVTTRLALPSSIGFAALFGSATAYGVRAVAELPWFARVLRRGPVPEKAPVRGAAMAVLFAMLIIHVHGFLAWNESQRTTEFYSYFAQARSLWPLTAPLDDRLAPTQRVVMISAADANDAPHLPWIRYAHGHPLLRGFRLLSGSPGAHELLRVDARTIELRVLDDWAIPRSIVGTLTRDDADVFEVGQHVALPDLRVDILETKAGQPVRMRYRFDAPLEDSSFAFVMSTPRGLQPFALPPSGGRMVLGPPAMPHIAPPARSSREQR